MLEEEAKDEEKVVFPTASPTRKSRVGTVFYPHVVSVDGFLYPPGERASGSRRTTLVQISRFPSLFDFSIRVNSGGQRWVVLMNL